MSIPNDKTKGTSFKLHFLFEEFKLLDFGNWLLEVHSYGDARFQTAYHTLHTPFLIAFFNFLIVLFFVFFCYFLCLYMYIQPGWYVCIHIVNVPSAFMGKNHVISSKYA